RKNLEPAVTDLLQAIGLLVRRVRAIGNNDEISLTQMVVMKHLDTDGPATIADLARTEDMKPQSMGAVVAALEEAGLVERRAHPTDGRQMNIVLTAKGAALRKRSGDAKRAWLAQGIGKLNESEQETLFSAGEIVRRLIEK
ncbi:MAG TPA: MarR family transcriptional regulator, partial [Methylovirgula sp.]